MISQVNYKLHMGRITSDKIVHIGAVRINLVEHKSNGKPIKSAVLKKTV
jgi:hypothetical protein